MSLLSSHLVCSILNWIFWSFFVRVDLVRRQVPVYHKVAFECNTVNPACTEMKSLSYSYYHHYLLFLFLKMAASWGKNPVIMPFSISVFPLYRKEGNTKTSGPCILYSTFFFFFLIENNLGNIMIFLVVIT